MGDNNLLDVLEHQLKQIKDLLAGVRLERNRLSKEVVELKRKLNIYRNNCRGEEHKCMCIKRSDLTYLKILREGRAVYNTIEYGNPNEDGVLIDLDKENKIVGIEVIRPVEVRTSKLME